MCKSDNQAQTSSSKVYNLQNDIVQKFTTQLISGYSKIHIEDLDIHGMTMSKRMGEEDFPKF